MDPRFKVVNGVFEYVVPAKEEEWPQEEIAVETLTIFLFNCNTGSTSSVVMKNTETLHDLMRLLKRVMATKMKSQEVIVEGKVLHKCCRQSLHDLGIKNRKFVLFRLRCTDDGVVFGNTDSTITLKVNMLTGRTLTVPEMRPLDKVEDLMRKISSMEGVPLDQQRLIFGGQQLEHNRTLSSYKVCEGSVVHLVLRLRGGMMHETSGREDMEVLPELLRVNLLIPAGVPLGHHIRLVGASPTTGAMDPINGIKMKEIGRGRTTWCLSGPPGLLVEAAGFKFAMVSDAGLSCEWEPLGEDVRHIRPEHFNTLHFVFTWGRA